ncbi:MAG TPA: TetR/AcrR family transcriptional regulator [Patescibacteria group bacterium]|nr:TetR/AcrR family transcriptional regulator [Patescibacteria group bacterium]
MTRDNIINTALRLFLLRGYKSVSLTDIAREAGITKGAIYHYFSSKEDMLKVAVEYLFGHIKAKMITLFSTGKNLDEILQMVVVEQVVEGYLDEVFGIAKDANRTNLDNFAFEVVRQFPDTLQRIYSDQSEICAAIRNCLQREMKNGKIRADLDIDALVTIVFTMAIGHKSAVVRYEDKHHREKVLETLCKMVFAANA